MQNPEMSVAEDIPVVVTGSPAGERSGFAQRVAANLRRPVVAPDPPLALPPDFPVDDFIVNIGLSLWQG